MRIVILDGGTVNPGDISWEPLESLGEVSVYSSTPKEKVIERIGDAVAILCTRTRIPREVFACCPQLRYVGLFATGYNIVDIDAATEHGAIVCNVPGYSTEAVAQHTFALLLEICQHISDFDRLVHTGCWEEGPQYYSRQPLLELRGKTMGIIGMGEIGYRTAKIAEAFGMQVLGTRRHPDPAMETQQIHFADFTTLLRESDIISIHCPLFPETRHLINRETISQMKDGAILLNTARGPILQEEDVAQALKSGKLSAVGVDVLSVEPPDKENPLLQAPNCIVTPHIAWAPRDTRIRLVEMVAENLQAFMRGKPIHMVNPEAWREKSED